VTPLSVCQLRWDHGKYANFASMTSAKSVELPVSLGKDIPSLKWVIEMRRVQGLEDQLAGAYFGRS
jgi:hypothetical protein